MIQLPPKLADFPLLPGVSPSQGIDAIPHLIADLINIAIFVAGGLSVIFLIVGGLRMVMSAGNSSNVAQARKTITFAIAGLILSLLAVAIVTVVNPSLTGGSGTGFFK